MARHGVVSLGTATLDEQTLESYSMELASIRLALGEGGQLDLWSCDVAAGKGGGTFVADLAARIGAGVAAADHAVGSTTLGGTWALDIHAGLAQPQLPFTENSVGMFHGILSAWTSAGSMSTGRINDTATLLSNGNVLVTGGYLVNNFVGLANADLYDPSTNTWSSAGSMATGRYSQTATSLQNGQVLVVGGSTVGGQVSSAELYDPTTNTWSSAGNTNALHSSAAATLLPDGQVLVTGGIREWDQSRPLRSARPILGPIQVT